MWERTIEGLTLTFHLAGINSQNFLMRDDQTGTYWQQISGLAIAGPLAGRRLKPVPSDELMLATWKAERPKGTVLDDVAQFKPEYAGLDWDVEMKRVPTVLSYAQPGLAPRDLMLGVRAFGASRAFPYEQVTKQKLVQDRVGPEPVILVVGQDGKSVRVFRARVGGKAADFYRTVPAVAPGRVMTDSTGAPPHPAETAAAPPDPAAPLFMDSLTGSGWNFQGCAVDGPSKGVCLERVETIKDYWFDWRNYNPATTVYGRTVRKDAKP